MQTKITRQESYGFTLIEVIAVLSILGFIVALGSRFVISTAKSHALASQQITISMDANLSMDRIAKALRYSLPNSLRITNNGQCLMYFSVVATGFYEAALPDGLNALPASGHSTPVIVSPHTIISGNARFMAVGAASPAELYGSNPNALASVQTRTSTSITLAADHQWQRNSTRNQFYLVDNPAAFCVVDNQLRHYKSVSTINASVDLGSSYHVLMQSVNSIEDNYFDINPNNCRYCVSLLFGFYQGEIQLNKLTTIGSRYEP